MLKKKSPILIQLVMVFVLLSQLSLHYLRPIAHLSEGTTDALSGFCIGVAIVLLALAARARQQRPTNCA